MLDGLPNFELPVHAVNLLPCLPVSAQTVCRPIQHSVTHALTLMLYALHN